MVTWQRRARTHAALVVGGLALTLVSGCSTDSTRDTSSPTPAHAPSVVPTPSATPIAIPARASWELARATWDGRTVSSGSAHTAVRHVSWYATGACNGRRGTHVSYRVMIDNAENSSAEIPCDTGRTYVNSAFDGSGRATSVQLLLDGDFSGVRSAFVRLVPEDHLTP